MPLTIKGMRLPLFLLLFSLTHWVVGDPLPPSFYDEKARGWFWKEIHPEPSIKVDPTSKEPSEAPTPNAPSPREKPLTTEWFRAHLGTIRDQALDDPSPENVRHYFLLQKVLLDKAERFAEIARSVVFKDPLLDERSHHPTIPSALALWHQSDNQERFEALSFLARKAGLLFVFRSDCSFCHVMAPLVSGLSKRIHMRLFAVSLDGGNLNGLDQATRFNDPLLGQKLNMTATPAIFLLAPAHGVHPVLEGSASAIELEEHLYEAGLTAGIIQRPDSVE